MRPPRLDGGQFANLHTFLAVAEHLSFARAAAELCLTPSAVSHRIARLEAALGYPLFLRLTRRIHLTDDGERIHAALRRGMDELNAALLPQADALAGRLTLHAHPSIAQCWLLPRLADFCADHPLIELDVRTGNEDADFRAGGVDLALYYADGQFPGLASAKLMEEEMAPVCSPSYAERHQLLEQPAKLRECVLLHDARAWRHAAHDAEWTLWARAAGREADLPPRSLTFDRSDLCLAAAVHHAGIAIGRRRLAQDWIDQGKLLLPLGGFTPVGACAYHLVHPPGATSARLRALIAWLNALASG
ncbi:DNA-binding transcriptional regulator DsdC [Chromobacterium alticapitis]|uniref:DNA-binding transcriptional regulator DsdC n=1 Tax=Chromobacterium alticapitis TaxID=2073169 RepID=A0A2S5DDG0_9NEIS|nr:DNA-binding transcriptional regulator DsdC [Chromobacterium alticapitis]POZ61007.1 DNA-binding transcriptional regulator DsdC [Chromobacterium alticapitis]